VSDSRDAICANLSVSGWINRLVKSHQKLVLRCFVSPSVVCLTAFHICIVMRISALYYECV